MLTIVILVSCGVLVGIGYLMLDILSGLVMTPKTPMRQVENEGELVIPLGERRLVSMQSSSDGRFLAYVDRGAEGGEAALNVVEPDRGPEAVFSRAVKGERLAWLGASHALVYEDGGDIHRLDIEGLVETNLTAGPELDREPLPSPDGRYILWTRSAPESGAGEAEFWIMNGDGSGQAFLAPRADLVTWNPVGGELASLRRPAALVEEGLGSFLQTTMPGMGRWEIYLECEGEALFVWWPRMDELFYVSRLKTGGKDRPIGIWIQVGDPTEPKRVASTEGLGPEVPYYRFYPSRSGAKLAYVGEKGLECMDYDEKVVYRFTRLEAETPLAWNEEAGAIYYYGSGGIYRVSLKGE